MCAVANPATEIPLPYAQSLTSCKLQGSAMLALMQDSKKAVVDAMKASAAAQNLRTNADYKAVEDDSNDVRTDVLQGYTVLGPIMGSEVKSARVMAATARVAHEAQRDLQTAQMLTQVALAYERAANTTRARRRKLLFGAPFVLVAPVLAAGYVAGVQGVSTKRTSTTGEIDGQPFSASSTSVDDSQVLALRAATVATQGDRLQALQLYTPQIGLLVYTLDPLIQKWSAACKAPGNR